MNMRPAVPGDCASIASIYNNYIGKATMDTQHRTAEYFLSAIEKMDPRERIMVLEVNDIIIGWGAIKKYSYKEGYRFACETSVFMSPHHRGRGYGSQFKSFIIEECKKLDYRHLVARIFRSNKVSIDYNLKLGYTIVGVQQKIGKVNGRWEDIVVMQYVVE